MNARDYTPHPNLNPIIQAALDRVDSAAVLERCLKVEGNVLEVRTESEELGFDLSKFERLLVLAVGKAAGRMARALEALLGERITAGVAITKYGHAEPLSRLELFEAGHPVPDEEGVRAARRLVELASEADERTLVITLISGGGSALLADPYHDARREVSLSDMQEVTRLLLASGASIQEMNCLRKHLSGVKGGRLAAILAPATSLNLILSDVVGDDVASIASGITASDPSTYSEALEIARRFEVLERFPKSAREVIEAGASGVIAETPDAGDPAFESVHNVIVGSNAQGLLAAEAAARTLGYETRVLTSRLTGEAREVGRLFPAIARDIRAKGMLAAPPACILAGGETTVTIRDAQGTGGRNQELVVSALREWARDAEEYGDAVFASVATDGNDGPTDAAGAYIDRRLASSAADHPAEVERALVHNDSYHYFERHGGLIKTGPTNTNVCDIQVLLVE